MTLKNWLTVAAQAFATGALGWLATHATVSVPATSSQWEALGIGLLIGGLGGLYHLYQPSPGKVAS